MTLLKLATSAAALSIYATASLAVPLTTGSGEGDVFIDVDAFGTFRNADFNPVGPIGEADTTFLSDVRITQGAELASLSSVATGVAGESNFRVISQSDTRYVTAFSVNNLNFTLTQEVAATQVDGVRSGSVLTQTYAMTPATIDRRFNLVRYLDGDLAFDNSISDGGGILQRGGDIVLFETDATGSASDADTFVGITASRGNEPLDGRYAITRYSGGNITTFPLPNTVQGDTDGDGFIDSPYDVTLQLAAGYSIPEGQTQIFTTQTLFGNAAPPAPGSTESLALLPDNFVGAAGDPFIFTINPADFFDGEFGPDSVTPTIWIDPIIATGYVYEVTGADFASVTAPSLAAVADGEYTLTFGGASVTLLAGETYTFGSGINSFSITGIDEALGLDPLDFTAFVTGVALTNISASTVTITQTPILTDTDAGGGGVSPVPLPASALLLLAGLGGIGAMRRTKA